jgi:two-component system LytT family sensor kinase
MFAKRFYWLAQFIGWTAYCGLLSLSVYTNNPSHLDSVFFFNIMVIIVSGIAVTHLQRFMFLKLGWLSFKLPRLIPRLLLSSFFFSIIIAIIDLSTDYMSNINSIRENPIEISTVIVNVFSILLLVLFWNAIYFTFHFFQQSRNQEVHNLELKASNRESELKNLRSQLNPHFLFNSLNSIRALITVEPEKAKVSITTLSNLLRQSLVLGRENLVALENELDLAKSYLELEKIRFEERLSIEWELAPGLELFEIPPFTLQMLVENAIKHGISNLKDGGVVRVKVIENNEEVVIEVKNSGNLADIVDLGVGIENIKQRLLLQYGAGAAFDLKEKEDFVYATMRFKK